MAAAKTNRRDTTGSSCRDRTDDRLKREHFLHPNSDQIDLNLLLQAVLDINEKLNDKQPDTMEEGVRTRASKNDWEVVKKEKDFDDTASRHSSASSASRSRPRSAALLNESRRPPPIERKNMSFSNAKVDAIDRENQRLLKQITRTRGRPKSAQPRKLLSEPLRVQTSSEVNRYRFQRKVDMENQVRDVSFTLEKAKYGFVQSPIFTSRYRVENFETLERFRCKQTACKFCSLCQPKLAQIISNSFF